MDKKSIIKKIILDFDPKSIDLVTRKLHVPLKTENVISIIGPRRSGKTYFLYQLIKELIEKNVGLNQIVYINFEDERLLPFAKDDLDLILEAYFELYPESSRDIWFFLDEIQNIPMWEKFVRRLSEKGFHLYISGSSSKLMSYEIATSLRGRVLPFLIYPFSFSEFLRFNKLNLKRNFSLTKQRFVIKKFFGEYFNFGGLPQTFSLEEKFKTVYLQEYINLVIYKDIVERYRIKNIGFIRDFTRNLIGETSNYFSVTGYYKSIKQSGLAISKDILFQYLSYLEEANIIFTVPIFSRSKKSQIVNPKKVYIVDQGLYNAIRVDQEKGKVLETIVFLELKRRGYEQFYYRGVNEVDIIAKKTKSIMPIQICFNLKDQKTKEREVSGLVEFCKKYSLKKAEIVTYDESGSMQEKNISIKFVPCWQWLLNKG